MVNETNSNHNRVSHEPRNQRDTKKTCCGIWSRIKTYFLSGPVNGAIWEAWTGPARSPYLRHAGLYKALCGQQPSQHVLHAIHWIENEADMAVLENPDRRNHILEGIHELREAQHFSTFFQRPASACEKQALARLSQLIQLEQSHLSLHHTQNALQRACSTLRSSIREAPGYVTLTSYLQTHCAETPGLNYFFQGSEDEEVRYKSQSSVLDATLSMVNVARDMITPTCRYVVEVISPSLTKAGRLINPLLQGNHNQSAIERAHRGFQTLSEEFERFFKRDPLPQERQAIEQSLQTLEALQKGNIEWDEETQTRLQQHFAVIQNEIAERQGTLAESIDSLFNQLDAHAYLPSTAVNWIDFAHNFSKEHPLETFYWELFDTLNLSEAERNDRVRRALAPLRGTFHAFYESMTNGLNSSRLQRAEQVEEILRNALVEQVLALPLEEKLPFLQSEHPFEALYETICKLIHSTAPTIILGETHSFFQTMNQAFNRFEGDGNTQAFNQAKTQALSQLRTAHPSVAERIERQLDAVQSGQVDPGLPPERATFHQLLADACADEYHSLDASSRQRFTEIPPSIERNSTELAQLVTQRLDTARNPQTGHSPTSLSSYLDSVLNFLESPLPGGALSWILPKIVNPLCSFLEERICPTIAHYDGLSEEHKTHMLNTVNTLLENIRNADTDLRAIITSLRNAQRTLEGYEISVNGIVLPITGGDNVQPIEGAQALEGLRAFDDYQPPEQEPLNIGEIRDNLDRENARFQDTASMLCTSLFIWQTCLGDSDTAMEVMAEVGRRTQNDNRIQTFKEVMRERIDQSEISWLRKQWHKRVILNLCTFFVPMYVGGTTKSLIHQVRAILDKASSTEQTELKGIEKDLKLLQLECKRGVDVTRQINAYKAQLQRHRSEDEALSAIDGRDPSDDIAALLAICENHRSTTLPFSNQKLIDELTGLFTQYSSALDTWAQRGTDEKNEAVYNELCTSAFNNNMTIEEMHKAAADIAVGLFFSSQNEETHFNRLCKNAFQASWDFATTPIATSTPLHTITSLALAPVKFVLGVAASTVTGLAYGVTSLSQAVLDQSAKWVMKNVVVNIELIDQIRDVTKKAIYGEQNTHNSGEALNNLLVSGLKKAWNVIELSSRDGEMEKMLRKLPNRIDNIDAGRNGDTRQTIQEDLCRMWRHLERETNDDNKADIQARINAVATLDTQQLKELSNDLWIIFDANRSRVLVDKYPDKLKRSMRALIDNALETVEKNRHTSPTEARNAASGRGNSVMSNVEDLVKPIAADSLVDLLLIGCETLLEPGFLEDQLSFLLQTTNDAMLDAGERAAEVRGVGETNQEIKDYLDDILNHTIASTTDNVLNGRVDQRAALGKDTLDWLKITLTGSLPHLRSKKHPPMRNALGIWQRRMEQPTAQTLATTRSDVALLQAALSTRKRQIASDMSQAMQTAIREVIEGVEERLARFDAALENTEPLRVTETNDTLTSIQTCLERIEDQPQERLRAQLRDLEELIEALRRDDNASAEHIEPLLRDTEALFTALERSCENLEADERSLDRLQGLDELFTQYKRGSQNEGELHRMIEALLNDLNIAQATLFREQLKALQWAKDRNDPEEEQRAFATYQANMRSQQRRLVESRESTHRDIERLALDQAQRIDASMDRSDGAAAEWELALEELRSYTERLPATPPQMDFQLIDTSPQRLAGINKAIARYIGKYADPAFDLIGNPLFFDNAYRYAIYRFVKLNQR